MSRCAGVPTEWPPGGCRAGPHNRVAVKSLQEIEADVSAMALRIAAPASALPDYGSSRDGAHPHVEVRGGAYQYVVVERGLELERRRTPDYHELLYWVFADVTHQMAFAYELRHRVTGQDGRRLAFSMQMALMAKIDAAYAQRLRREIERILKKAPYRDDPGR